LPWQQFADLEALKKGGWHRLSKIIDSNEGDQAPVEARMESGPSLEITEEKPTPSLAARVKDLIEAARPRQWTKNLIVFGPLIFSAKIGDFKLLLATLVCSIAFCLASSSIYLINDLLDREQDKVHPRKRNRPIASGRVSTAAALSFAFVLAAASLTLSVLIKPSIAVMIVLYLGLMVFYGTVLKHLVVLDVMTVAAGFVLRAVAGGIAASAPVSGWFLLCTSFGSLFLALEKRRHEISTLSKSAQDHRAVLQSYSQALIDKIEGIVVPGLVVCYIFYSFLSYHGQWMMITVPFVFYGLIRYHLLSIEEALTGTPEEVLLRDRPTQVTIVLWLLTSLGVLYNVIPGGIKTLFDWLDGMALIR
jgi:4-hydroxybenzoate polyprenyltransferase